ncbi:ThuA domain-containing protein [Cellulosimicrobium arenosum]|uniref:ThuA domain-containing protein n=1 Tax=Cellulosimicrobium arenosum TaxID=2708133 RepID=UPI0030CA3A1F
MALPLTLATAVSANAATVPSTPLQAVDVAAAADTEPFDVLVFSKTAGFRHGSIPAGIAAIEQLGEDNGFTVTATEDAGAFTDENLSQYEAVVFLSTTGDVLGEDQQAAFEQYVQDGGGYAGIHAASDTEYDWPWYGELVGAYFSAHPQNQDATVKVEDHVHESTAHLPARWERFDEWYNFQSNPRDTVHVLASLDETSYDAGSAAMGSDHPTAWCQDYDGGRSWYTGGGHTDESYADPDFLQHLLGGIQTAAGVVDSDCNATQSDSYELVPLDTDTGNPMVLDVAPDGTVFYGERDGRVQVIDPETNTTHTATTLPVTTANEDGLLGLVLDPDFAENRWVYAYWAPSAVGDEGPHNRISRFDYDPATGTIDQATQKEILSVTTQRNTCCHAGGDMVFDNDGNLVLATGDNTNPFESSGYSPIDERPGREDYDSQRGAGNTNDLRGSVLRIHPEADGTYTIPEGNLFDEADDADDLTRPEIYAMGFRNPFRIDVDPFSGNIVLGDYGPDAGSSNPNRGPGNTVEWNVLSEPGFYGWPYCTGANNNYRDYNFATGQSGDYYDCAAGVINDSPNNTGLSQLPPAIEAEVWYNYAGNPDFPEIGGGGAPMGGPVYQYDADLDSDVKWPAYWDGKALFAEWNQGNVYSFDLTGENRDDIVDINRVLPGIFNSNSEFNKVQDWTFGPDGALYLSDWGSEFNGSATTSGIYRVDYVRGNPSPIAQASADVTSGPAPLTVQFSSEGTRHPSGADLALQWTFGDGSEPSTEANPVHTYTENGSYTAQLTATDAAGQVGVANVTIVVGNEAPTMSITFPDNGGFFEWGDQVKYEIQVDDPDGEVDCSEVQLSTALGHNAHAHPMDVLNGCEGTFETLRDEGHGIDQHIFWVIDASYTDDGGEAGAPLTVSDTQILQPKLLQAEFFTSTGRLDGSTSTGDPGVESQETTDEAGGGQNIGYIEPGDWWAYDPISLYMVDSVTLRAAALNGGTTISVRWNAPDGPEIGSVDVPSTGDWQVFTEVTADLHDVPAGTGTLYFVETSGGSNVNWLEFNGRGVTDNERPTIDTFDVTATEGTAPLEVTATVAATDPEDEEITYSWDAGFGDGFEEGSDTFTVTYDQPGTYRLQVRAADERGAYNTMQKTITVEAQDTEPAQCFSGRSDDFTGDELDGSRWSVLNQDQNLAVDDGELVIPTSGTDFYSTDNTAVPNIVLQDLPSGPFTATAKVTLPARQQYQQAGLVIWEDQDNYAKMVIQGRSSAADASTRIFQFIREEAATPNEVDDSNSANVGADYPDTVYVRFVSDGENLQAAYSADGTDFTTMPETKSITDLENAKIGLTALKGNNTSSPVIDARFDWFTITPDDTAEAPGPDDEFDGDALDTCRWSVVREDPTGYRVADGALQIDTTPTDIYGTDNTDVPNIVVQDQPEGDEWTIETVVDGSSFDRQYQQGGLIVYGDDDNYVKFDFVTDNTAGSALSRRIELRSEVGGVVQDPQPQVANLTDDVWHLRLTRSGDSFTGAYSADGETWTTFEQSVSNAAAADAQVGLFALGAAAETTATASFDYFRVVDGDEPEPVAVTVTVQPRCLAGKVFVAVRALNADEVPIAVTLETPFGDKSYEDVAPGASAYQSFAARAASVEAGSVTVTATDAEGRTFSETADYAAQSCA